MSMPPSDALLIQAYAHPGESWVQVRLRVQRLLKAVTICEPCGAADCGGWVEWTHPLAYCVECSCLDGWNYDHRTGREYPDV